ncbi:MAG: ABC-2 transporter permease [Lachnospiraceae bacterium]|nr:ABC-2 transporter permease [Lachnospiraceae bacterium]
MKGLLIKDFKLLKSQKNFFVIIALITAGMPIYMEDSSFIIGYMTFFGSLFTLSTISYDEFDNGNAFLFSLPFSRKSYTLEKYEFGLIIGGIFWLFATVIAIIAEMTKNSMMIKETLMTALLMVPVMIFLLAIMLPFQFKFGGEKSRIAIIGAVGLVVVTGLAAVKIAELFHIDLAAVFNSLPAMGMGMAAAAGIGITVLVLLISLKISVGIMNKKEF